MLRRGTRLLKHMAMDENKPRHLGTLRTCRKRVETRNVSSVVDWLRTTLRLDRDKGLTLDSTMAAPMLIALSER